MTYRYRLSGPQARVVALIVGLALFAYTGYSAYKSTVAQSWTRTGGTISESRTQRRIARSGRYRRHTRAVIKYKYRVAGTSFENDRLTFTTFTPLNLNIGELKTGFFATMEKYPKGKPIVVYYNPKNPSESILEPKLTSSFYALVLIAGGLTAFGTLGLLPDDGPRRNPIQEQFPQQNQYATSL